MRFPSATAWRATGWLLRFATAAALAVAAYVHADLAARYAANGSPGGLSQGDLFRIYAGAASLAALLIVLTARWLVWAIAALVAASGLAAIMISANYDIGSIGPIPDMYEPFWYAEKTLTAWAEAIATGLAVVGFVLASRFHGRPASKRPAARDNGRRNEELIDATVAWRE